MKIFLIHFSTDLKTIDFTFSTSHLPFSIDATIEKKDAVQKT